MKPFVRTSFLRTRPSCFPSPGWPLCDTDDRKPILWLGLPSSPVNSVNWLVCDGPKNGCSLRRITKPRSNLEINCSFGQCTCRRLNRRKSYFLKWETAEIWSWSRLFIALSGLRDKQFSNIFRFHVGTFFTSELVVQLREINQNREIIEFNIRIKQNMLK